MLNKPKLDEIIYSVIVMICLTWAIFTIAKTYQPPIEQKPQIEQEELIEITKVESNDN